LTEDDISSANRDVVRNLKRVVAFNKKEKQIRKRLTASGPDLQQLAKHCAFAHKCLFNQYFYVLRG